MIDIIYYAYLFIELMPAWFKYKNLIQYKAVNYYNRDKHINPAAI